MTHRPFALTPRDAAITLFGAFVRALGNWIAIADMVMLLGELGVDEQSARSAIARLKRGGLLVSEKHAGHAGYAASRQLLDVLAEGDVRIFQSQLAADLDDGWVLVVFTVPETERDRRHLLRVRLAALGCGPLAPGVWMAPRRVSADVRRVLERLDLAKYASLFAGDYEGFTDLRSLAARTWNLAALSRNYAAFAKRQQRVLERWQRADDGPRAAFIDYTTLIEQWRLVAYEDPGLPDEVTSYATPRRAAREVFSTAVERLSPAARAHVESTMGPRRVRVSRDTGRGR